jgi:hypothetical protein
MKHLKWIGLAFLLFPLFTNAQHWQWIQSYTFENPDKISIDRYDQIYLSNKEGMVQQVSPALKNLLLLSPNKPSTIANIEAWNSIKIFIFYKDLQEFNLTDRFLTQQSNFKLNPELVGFTRSATLANDGHLWVVDDEDFGLKKIDLQNEKVLIRSPFDLVLSQKETDIGFMREYQNFLYVNDKNNGILVFDNMGNYKKMLPFPGLSYFGFKDNRMYFIDQNDLIVFDLYRLDSQKIKLPETKLKIQKALCRDQYWYFIHPQGIELYELLP